jgi:AcrR family transcriptional regulator
MKSKSKTDGPLANRLRASASRSLRGPQPAFSRDQIAAAAVKIADGEGIEAVSLRRIAAEIGSGATSLYRYIGNKDELLDLMVERVLPEYTLPKRSGGWRRDLRKIASQNRKMILRHPWMIAISAFRSSLGPGAVRWLELTLNAIDDLGLNIDEMLVVSNTLFAFAKGYAAGEIAEQEASRRSGLTREQWMMSRAEQTRAILRTGAYPMFDRLVKDARAPHDPRAAERGFSLGLDHILDGIEMRILAGSSSRVHPSAS